MSKPKEVHMSKKIVSEPYAEYLFKTDYTVCLEDETGTIIKTIVDRDGNIFDFPGVTYSDILADEYGTRKIEPIVKYEAIFERVDERKFIMVWMIRPDGRYWMDSWGFGAEDYESISLYAYLDLQGNFTTPFQLYSVGYQFYGEYRLKGDRL